MADELKKASEKEVKKEKPAKKAKKNGKPFGEKVKSFFRVYKSELKKITWTPKETVRKNSVVVLVVVAATAAVLGVLDLVFTRGINALATLLG